MALMQTHPLDPAAIAADLGTLAVPRTISCHGAVGSTMDLARDLLARLSDSELPALVVADEQTAGRGRLGRAWVAPPGTALLTSLAFRPRWLPSEQGVALVWLAGVALCEAVEVIAPLRLGLKWPNDLLVAARESDYETADLDELSHHQASPAAAAGRPRPAPQRAPWAKAAGLLLEVSHGQRGIEGAIVGCGINLSVAPPPEATRYPATSLAEASGRPVGRLELLRELLRRYDHWYLGLQAGGFDTLYEAWRARLVTLGQRVRIDTPAGPLEGLAEDVDRGGGLLVRTADGRRQLVTAGDVGLLE